MSFAVRVLSKNPPMWTSRRPGSSRQPRPFVRPARAHPKTHGTKMSSSACTRAANPTRPSATRLSERRRFATGWALAPTTPALRLSERRDRRILERSRSRWVEPPRFGTVRVLVAPTQPKHRAFKIGVVRTTRKMNGSCFSWFEPPRTRTVHVSGSSNHQEDERFMFSVRRRNESPDRFRLPRTLLHHPAAGARRARLARSASRRWGPDGVRAPARSSPTSARPRRGRRRRPAGRARAVAVAVAVRRSRHRRR